MSAMANIVLSSPSPAAATEIHRTQLISGRSLATSTRISCHGRYRKQQPLIPELSRRNYFSSSLTVKAATSEAINSDQLSSSDLNNKEEEEKAKKYHFVVANAKFMLDEEEHFQELMFERLRLYKERNKEQDFWLVIEPKFLDKFPNITKRLRRPAVALVSTNGTWITFMKLRLDRVLSESYEADSIEEALASNPTKLEFPKPENWVAPYPKYEFGWWEPFLLPVKKEEAKI